MNSSNFIARFYKIEAAKNRFLEYFSKDSDDNEKCKGVCLVAIVLVIPAMIVLSIS